MNKPYQSYRMYRGSRGEPLLNDRAPADFCRRCGQYDPENVSPRAPYCWDEFLGRFA